MVNALNAAVSGFNAAAQRLNANANNIANSFSTQTQTNGVTTNTPYVPQQVDQTAQVPAGGVITHNASINPPSIQVYDPNNVAANAQGITNYPNVDQAQQLVGTQVARYTAQGNLDVIKVENHLLQSVINIIS
jgi:flagellar basal-body rod protein FlgC